MCPYSVKNNLSKQNNKWVNIYDRNCTKHLHAPSTSFQGNHTPKSTLHHSVQLSHSVMSDALQPNGLEHDRHPCPSQTPRVYSESYPLSWWCYLTISASVVPFPSCPQSFPASGYFQMSQFVITSGQSIGISASASALPMNIQDGFPLGWTGLISLLSEGLSRVFSNTTVQKHQFFSAQHSLHPNSHIHTWLLENHSFD